MSFLSVTASAFMSELAPGKKFWRPATIGFGMLLGVFLIVVTIGVLSTGYVRHDIQVLLSGEDWRSGGWLSRIVVHSVGLLPSLAQRQLVLSLLASAVSGVLFAALYDRLRRNGWFAWGALGLLAALVAHAGTLYTFTASATPIPLFIAFAVIVPAVRALEKIGDVQAAIALGMVLPLLVLAGPLATLLVVPLAVGAALANEDARSDPRAFIAMLLVGLLPTIIVIAGILGFTAQAGQSPLEVLVPYAYAYGSMHWGDALTSIAALTAFAPCFVVPIAYCFWPKLPERRNIYSALAVVILPLYLAVARVVFNSSMSQMTPALALLAAFASWLAIVRLPFSLRALAVLMLAVSAAMSWLTPMFWDDPEWRTSFLQFITRGAP